MTYCTPLELIAHANRARLIGQLAGSDYAPLPAADDVQQYFTQGIVAPGYEQALSDLKARVEQAINLAAGDIDGYLTLLPDMRFPVETLKTACMDMALYRLFDVLDDKSVVKQLNDARHAFFNRLITGAAAKRQDAAYGSAQTDGPAAYWTDDRLQGY